MSYLVTVGFHLYDLNHDNSIERNELKIMLMKIGTLQSRQARTPLTVEAKVEQFVNTVFSGYVV